MGIDPVSSGLVLLVGLLDLVLVATNSMFRYHILLRRPHGALHATYVRSIADHLVI